MNPINPENFEQKSLAIEKFDIAERLNQMNKYFRSAVFPENGAYGVTEVVKDTGVVERIWRDIDGLLNKAYLKDDQIYCLRGKTLDGNWVTTRTADNISKFIDGEMTVADIAIDIGTAVAIGYGSGFVTSAVSQSMKESSKGLIKSLGKTGVPAAAISFGITSYESVSDFAKGEIDAVELAYYLADSAASATGEMADTSVASTAGGIADILAATKTGAAIGSAMGSVVPVAGTAAGGAIGAAAGFGLGVVGGMAGTAIASEAYKSAVEIGSEGVKLLADKAQEAASNTVELAKSEIPEYVNDVKSALNNFAGSHNLPFHV